VRNALRSAKPSIARAISVDRKPYNAFKYKAFSPQSFFPEGSPHETHLSTLGRQAQADARLSRPHEVHWRPQGALGASRQGSRPPDALIARAALRGLRPFRLTGKGSFDALFKVGRRRDGDYVQLIAAPAPNPPGRLGLVVPKKVLPLAVDRNRVRRMLRAAQRAARPAVLDYDVILRLTRGCPRTEFRQVAAEATRLLAALPRGPSR
jgi:ribonuclease P protein component